MGNRSDDFNRANGTLNGSTPSDGGSAWVGTGTTYSISSNEADAGAPFVWQPVYLEASSAVGELSFVVRALGNSGIAARIVDASNFWLLQIQSGSLGLFKRTAGTFTQYGSTYTGTISVGDAIKLAVTSGDVWTVSQNGTLRINPGTSDSAHNTATKYGYAGYSGSAKYDDMVFTDTSGGGGGSVFAPYFYREHIAGVMHV